MTLPGTTPSLTTLRDPYTSARNASSTLTRCRTPVSIICQLDVVDDPRHDVEREGPLVAADIERDALVEVAAGDGVDARPQLADAEALHRLGRGRETASGSIRRRRPSRPTPRPCGSRRTSRPSSRSYGGSVTAVCRVARRPDRPGLDSGPRARGQLDAVVGLDGRDAEIAGRRRPVELSRRDHDADPLGQVAGGRPGVALRGRQPQVERAVRQSRRGSRGPPAPRPDGRAVGGSARAGSRRVRRRRARWRAAAWTGPGGISPACLRTSRR